SLLARGIRVAGLASPNPQVLRWASEHAIPCFDTGTRSDTGTGSDTGSSADVGNANDGLVAAVQAAGSIDYVISVTYLQMIPAAVIAAANRMAINFHDSMLPRYAGLNVTSWAIAAGETVHGITWHRLTDKPDTGDVLLQVPVAIAADETALTLNTKCFEAATESMDAMIDRLLDDDFVPSPQDLSARTYFGRHHRPSVAGWIDHRNSADVCAARVRSLDFGKQFENPLATAKIRVNDSWFVVGRCEIATTKSGDEPGTIVRVADQVVWVATSTTDIGLSNLTDLAGAPLATEGWENTFRVGTKLGLVSETQASEIDAAYQTAAKQESSWISRLKNFRPLEIGGVDNVGTQAARTYQTVSIELPEHATTESVIAVFAMCLGKITGQTDFEFSLATSQEDSDAVVDSLFASQVPVSVSLDRSKSVDENAAIICDQIGKVTRQRRYLRDLGLRFPAISKATGAPSVTTRIVNQVGEQMPNGSKIDLQVNRDGSQAVIGFDASRLNDSSIGWLNQAGDFIRRAFDEPAANLGRLSLSSAESVAVIQRRNETHRVYDRQATVDGEFVAQAAKTPGDVALVCGDRQWTYAELADRVGQVAAALQARGVCHGDRVGIATSRSLDMVAALFAVMKVGGTYVPLDLEFPASRIEFMIADADLRCIVVDSASVTRLPICDTPLLDVDSINADGNALDRSVSVASDLAYVIYTSGSTGLPKGVTVSHRNVMNFFAGMDVVIPDATPESCPSRTWLAVTSLSFDISVLELLWTVCRGFKVILHDTPSRIASADRHRVLAHQVKFGLFYFSSSAGSNQSESSNDSYRLLLEGAKFADANGFSSVWTPERHFHDFGGLYPNPAVTGAAVAAITSKVAIRSGSVVLPLHHPARVAEEWAMVDRLSGGRVGVSFASGWQPNDFVLAPGNYATAKQVMFENLETVRKLWRGETVEMVGPDDASVSVQTYPRPIQKELPVWITTAGNEDTFRQAGKSGCNVLTHLLGQTTDELAIKIKAYRESRAAAGHVGPGEVSVMVHTFVGDDTDKVKQIVRGPMIEYLRTSASLVRGFSHTWAAFKKRSDGTTAGDLDLDSLSSEDMDDLLSFSFERYFETSGLFGTPEKCQTLVRKLQEAGTTEIACLIDFGASTDESLAALHHLNHLKDLVNEQTSETPAATISQLVDLHDVTHFQCTPSMAQMLIEDDASATAIRSIPNVLLGGEALPAQLATRLTSDSSVALINVYGPTETTVWSTSTKVVSGEVTSVSIGRPIANTFIYLLDDHGNHVPEGEVGNLWIGGDGVVPGYWNRKELTREKFQADPFVNDPDARIYHTGDMAKWTAKGDLEFLGRSDHQVKIRGHRIELGDIENAIDAVASIRQSVVIPKQSSASEQTLAAFLVLHDGVEGSPDFIRSLRSGLRQSLPAHMMPAHFVVVDAFPLTPNGKVDRKVLGMLPVGGAAKRSEPAPPVVTENASLPDASETQQQITSLWKEVLQLDVIDLNDNFFDLGGHSLLAVRMHRQLRDQLGVAVAITDLFRFPTVQTLSAHLDSLRTNVSETEAESAKPAASPSPASQSPASQSVGQSRASRRREMMQRRVAGSQHPQEANG
ncbi:MAG: MupA/Atu3671 family FMN-dependent luciferase-like monooxygenase, partial [Rubripirellula sp.]